MKIFKVVIVQSLQVQVLPLREAFGNVSQILSDNYSSLNGTWQTTDGSTKIILNNGNIIFSPEYERIISDPVAKDGIVIADALNDKRHMGFMFAAAHNSPLFPNSSNVDKTDSEKVRLIITTGRGNRNI